jgi:hypothetical protein
MGLCGELLNDTVAVSISVADSQLERLPLLIEKHIIELTGSRFSASQSI